MSLSQRRQGQRNHLMKPVMFLWDPTAELPLASHKEASPIPMKLISHLRHHISGAPFLLIQALSSSREDTYLCTCLKSTRHANSATNSSTSKHPKDDLGYQVPSLQTREYDAYCCLDIFHLVHSVPGLDVEKGRVLSDKNKRA